MDKLVVEFSYCCDLCNTCYAAQYQCLCGKIVYDTELLDLLNSPNPNEKVISKCNKCGNTYKFGWNDGDAIGENIYTQL